MITERMVPEKSTPLTRGMAVEGEEAVDLYVAEFWRRIDALNRQIGLLQNAFAERKQLLREIEEEHDLRKGH